MMKIHGDANSSSVAAWFVRGESTTKAGNGCGERGHGVAPF
jgi:hypothetical protein